MAVVRTAYTGSYDDGFPGMIANSEVQNVISREVETVAGIGFGQPAFQGAGAHGIVVGATFAATATAAAVAGNVGNGTMGAITVSAGAKRGRYILTIIEPAVNAGAFIVSDPDGLDSGNGDVAAAYSMAGLAFTLADGATDFVAGDQFTIDTTFSANALFLGITVKDVTVMGATADLLPRYWTAPVLTQGVIWITAGATVTAGSDVYWNPAASRYTSTTTHIRIPGARFDTAGVDGGLAKIALR